MLYSVRLSTPGKVTDQGKFTSVFATLPGEALILVLINDALINFIGHRQ
jgi:hypothetical protein